MDEITAKALREPFAAELVGKLPRVWCAACREARGKVCDRHQRVKCDGCGSSITSAHLHLDFVGHADVTDRLLRADPSWTWEPVAFGTEGLPLLDRHGGLWLRLTVAGVTRYGYGHADGKSGPDAVKEAIGDGLRNAAMRFGVALDLWRKEPPSAEPHRPPQQDRPVVVGMGGEAGRPRPPARDATYDANDPKKIHRRMHALFREAGIGDDRTARLEFASQVIDRHIDSSSELTPADVDKVIKALEAVTAEPKEGTPEG